MGENHGPVVCFGTWRLSQERAQYWASPWEERKIQGGEGARMVEGAEKIERKGMAEDLNLGPSQPLKKLSFSALGIGDKVQKTHHLPNPYIFERESW